MATICTAVILFNVRLQPTSILPIDFGGRADVLAMLLAVAVLLLTVSFLVRAITDLLRDNETSLLVTKYIEKERVDAANAAAGAVDEQLSQTEDEERYGPSDPDPWWEGAIKISEESEAAVKRAEDRLGVRRLPRWLRRMRKWAEVAIPLLFGIAALFLSRAHLASFSSALFKGLRP